MMDASSPLFPRHEATRKKHHQTFANSDFYADQTPLRKRENDSFFVAPTAPMMQNNNTNSNSNSGAASTASSLPGGTDPLYTHAHRRRRRGGGGVPQQSNPLLFGSSASHGSANMDRIVKKAMKCVLLSPVLVLMLWLVGTTLFFTKNNANANVQSTINNTPASQQSQPHMAAVHVPVRPKHNTNHNNKQHASSRAERAEEGLLHAVEVIEAALGRSQPDRQHHIPVINPLGSSGMVPSNAMMMVSNGQQQQGLVVQPSNLVIPPPQAGAATEVQAAPLPALGAPEAVQNMSPLLGHGGQQPPVVMMMLANPPPNMQAAQPYTDNNYVQPNGAVQQSVGQQQAFMMTQQQQQNNGNANQYQMMQPMAGVGQPVTAYEGYMLANNNMNINGQQQQQLQQRVAPQAGVGQAVTAYEGYMLANNNGQQQQMQQQQVPPAGVGQPVTAYEGYMLAQNNNNGRVQPRPRPHPRQEGQDFLGQLPPLQQQQQLVQAPAAGASMHGNLRGGGNKEPATLYYYYDPAQVVSDGTNVYLPEIVYDAAGRPTRMDRLAAATSQIYLSQHPPPMGAIRTNETVYNNSTTNTTTGVANNTHFHPGANEYYHPNTIHTPVREHERGMSFPSGAAAAWSEAAAADNSIIVCTVAVVALLVGALSARKMRARSFLSSCIENESLSNEVAYDAAYTLPRDSGTAYSTFGGGSSRTHWKGDMEKFDV